MVSAFQSRVNLKLSEARVLLAYFRDCSAKLDSPLLGQALSEAVAGHLGATYRSYLRELADSYGLAAADIACLADLSGQLLAGSNPPAEVVELEDLHGRPQTWLSAFLRCLDELELPQARVKSSVKSANTISLLQVSDEQESSDCSIDNLTAWLAAFDELIRRQRSALVEC